MDGREQYRWELAERFYALRASREAGFAAAVLLCQSDLRRTLFSLGGLMGEW